MSNAKDIRPRLSAVDGALVTDDKPRTEDANSGRLRKIALLGAILTLGACAENRLSAVAVQDTHRAIVLGIPNARIFADDNAGFVAVTRRSIENQEKYYASIGRPLPLDNYLVLSGGGDDAAFGAGLLVGLSEAGRRPSFTVVTGISAGALLAPFAFLGPEFDPTLKELFAKLGPQDVFKTRPILAGLTSDALADTSPLKKLIAKYVNEAIVQRIADEYRHGRRLAIATTDLDAGLSVVWDIGAIANSENPRAVALIQQILLASASIPAVFPPVMFDVTVDGVPHQEMHSDGGAMQQTFLYPQTLDVVQLAAESGPRPRNAYIVRNARLKVEWHQTQRSTFGIAARAFGTITTGSGDSDLYRLFALAKRDGIGFQLAFIDNKFTAPHPDAEFDHEYMTKLFDYARHRAYAGDAWQSAPPGF
jgi:predicted acylesterase/phospholipase RssA